MYLLWPRHLLLVNGGEKIKIEVEKEEKWLVEQNSDYHQGVPAIIIMLNGDRSKRAHKHFYNAKSGVVIIIGQHT